MRAIASLVEAMDYLYEDLFIDWSAEIDKQ